MVRTRGDTTAYGLLSVPELVFCEQQSGHLKVEMRVAGTQVLLGHPGEVVLGIHPQGCDVLATF